MKGKSNQICNLYNKHKVFIHFVLFVAIYVVCIVLDITQVTSAMQNFVKDKWPHLVFDLKSKTDVLIGLYGTVWIVSLGFIIFVIQNGYGNILGLRMLDIISLCIPTGSVWFIIGGFALKFVLYIIAYCYHLRLCILFGIIEVFLSFIYLIRFFTKIADDIFVFRILQTNVIKYMQDVKIEECKLTTCTKNIDYKNSAECDYLAELLLQFLRELQKKEENWSQHSVIRATNTLKQIMSNICFSKTGRKRIEYLLKTCFENGNDIGNYWLFMLLACVVDTDAGKLTVKELGKILAVKSLDDAAQIALYFDTYIVCVQEFMDDFFWGDMYGKTLRKIYLDPQICLDEEDMKSYICKMICMQAMEAGEEDMSSFDMEKHYNELMIKVSKRC